MVNEPPKLEDLFPTAKDLFPAHGKNNALPLVAWTVAGAVALLLGYRLLRWFDRNL